MEPIRFFIGTDANGGCAECQMVLEYSIWKNCSRPYEINWMAISDDPNSFWDGWETRTWSTPFSGFRYGIPEYCGYEGQAIYQDDDQMWLVDPAELWDIEIQDPNIMTGKKLPNGEIRHCVFKVDNEKFESLGIPVSRRKGNPNFNEMMKQATFPRTQIMDPNFNNFDGENEDIENIKVLHMTDMRTNPGVHLAVKRLGDQSKHWFNGQLIEHRRPDVVEIFHQYYNEALEAGFKVEDYLPGKRIDYKTVDQTNYTSRNCFDVSQGQ